MRPLIAAFILNPAAFRHPCKKMLETLTLAP